jgi:TRAP-type C4-dicarboxylate transport system permease small subunit
MFRASPFSSRIFLATSDCPGHIRKEILMNILKLTDMVLLNVLKAVSITSFVLLTLLVTSNVVVRFVPVVSLHWFDEIIELLVAYLVFYGSAALWISREHFSVGDWIGKRLAGRQKHFYRLVVESITLVFALIFFYYSYALTDAAEDVTNVFAIPKWILYSCLPVSGGIMIIYSVRNIITELAGIIKGSDAAGGDVCTAAQDKR